MADAGEGAYETLVGRHTPKIKRRIRKFIRSHEMVDDVCQDILVQLWQAKYQIGTNFEAFLYTLIKRTVYRYTKQAARSPSVSMDERVFSDGETTYAEWIGGEDTIGERLINSESHTAILNAIEKLSPRLRTVARLSLLEDMDLGAVSRKVGTTYESVRQHKRRAIEKLREIIDDEYAGELTPVPIRGGKRVMSESHKAKISCGCKGRKGANKGKKLSMATRKKISDSAKRRWARTRQS